MVHRTRPFALSAALWLPLIWAIATAPALVERPSAAVQNRLFGPNFPALADTNGNGMPDAGDTALVPTEAGGVLQLDAPWDCDTGDGNNQVTLQDTDADGKFDLGFRINGAEGQVATFSAFVNGAPTAGQITLYKNMVVVGSGTAQLVDQNGDGVFEGWSASGQQANGRHIRISLSLVYADVTSEGDADYISIPWALSGAIGVKSTPSCVAALPQVWFPLADTDGDDKPDGIAVDLDGDDVIDSAYFTSPKLAPGCLDADSDTICDAVDNCPADGNTDQIDTDGDAVGDPCDPDTATDLIFADGVESGDFTAWSSTNNDGSLVIEDTNPLNGANHFCAVLDNIPSLYSQFLQDDSPVTEQRYRARFLFDTDAFDPGEAQNHRRMRLLIGFRENPQRRLLAVVLRRVSGAYSLLFRTRRDDNFQESAGPFDIEPGVHSVQIDWRHASSPGSNDGQLIVWIDEVPVGSLDNLDNDTGVIDFVRLGALSVKGGADGTLCFDQFESRRFGAIVP